MDTDGKSASNSMAESIFNFERKNIEVSKAHSGMHQLKITNINIKKM